LSITSSLYVQYTIHNRQIMHSTRRLLTAATTTAAKGYQMPPRSHWDTIVSAGNAALSLFDQNARDNFISRINSGIINPSIVGQADLGIFMTLALHHDLSSDLFKKYKFDAKEFLEGSEGALENFQEILYSVDKKIVMAIEEELKVGKLASSSTSSTSEEDDENNATPESIIEDQINVLKKKEELIQTILATQIEKKAEAEKDPDSLEGQLKNMVSQQLFEAIETQFVTNVIQCYMNDMSRLEYQLDSGEVSSATLLSARAHEVIPEETQDSRINTDVENDESKKDEKPEIMEDESFSNGIDKKYPVAAQLEVIYTLTQTFSRKKIGGKSEKHDSDAEEDEQKEDTMDTAWVAIFEGWLENGREPLRWTLVNNRPAWEFPMVG